jgi:hypothetical protein
MSTISRRQFVSAIPAVGAGAWLGLGLEERALACPGLAEAQSATLFENVRVFDSASAAFSAPSHALVEAGKIVRVSTEPIAAEPGVTLVAGGGRTLIPGLIEWHARAMATRAPDAPLALTSDWNHMLLMLGHSGETTLKTALERAIDVGIVLAPRVWPASALLQNGDRLQEALGVIVQPDRLWGSFTSVHAETADPITAAIAGRACAPSLNIAGATVMLLTGTHPPPVAYADLA